MKIFLLASLCLVLPVSARTPTPAPKATPAPVVAQETTSAVPMARQRTVQEDAELRDWIVGIQTIAQEAQKRADAAEVEAKSSRDQSAIAGVKLADTEKHLAEIQAAYNTVQDERDKAITDLANEHKARVAAEHHVSRIKTWLGFALGGLLVLLVQYIPFSIFPPPMSIYGRVAASVAAFGLGWIIVARFV